MNRSKETVLVTGSSGSLGSFLCGEFLEEGYRVTGLDLKPSSSLPGKHDSKRWQFFECDLSSPAHVESALAKAHSESGPFRLVVNNVGLIHNAPLLRLENGKLEPHDFEDWNRVLSVTLSACFYVTALCAQKMAAASKPGVIINISSICAAGNAGQAAYSAAKAGVNSLTASLGKELGPLGIRVAAIAPGFLDTASTRSHLSEQQLAQLLKAIPLRKLGRAQDLMAAVRFIMENDYFHGKVLELDGGLTL